MPPSAMPCAHASNAVARRLAERQPARAREQLVARARRELRRAAHAAVLRIAALRELACPAVISSDAVEPRRIRAERAAPVVRVDALRGRRRARARCPRHRRAAAVRVGHRLEQVAEARPARTAARAGSTCRGSTAARRAGRTPTAASRRPRPHHDRVHEDRVDVGALLAVDLHVDEQLVHQLRGRRVLEALVRHHVAPVARRVADRDEHRLVEPPRLGERLLAPRPPRRPGCRRAAAGTASSRRRDGSA